MKKISLIFILSIIVTSAMAHNEVVTTKPESPKIKAEQIIENNNSKPEFFDSLRKPNSNSHSQLGLGVNKQEGNSKGTEICNVAVTDDGKTGSGLCGVPANISDEEKNKSLEMLKIKI